MEEMMKDMQGDSKGYLLAIDPGSEESAYALLAPDYRAVEFGKLANEALGQKLDSIFSTRFVPVVAIEMIGHYGTGMPAGADVFETCLEIGKLLERCSIRFCKTYTVKRPFVKAHLCGVPNAKDSNVIQALIDRFAPHTPNHGKGRKGEPGFFYGFRADIWQAYALGVVFLDWLNMPESERNKRNNMIMERF